MEDPEIIIENDDKSYVDNGKPHNNKPITMIEVSPNGKFLITYSKLDESFVGWNVVDIDKSQFEPGEPHKSPYSGVPKGIQMCASDDKKLVYIYDYLNMGK